MMALSGITNAEMELVDLSFPESLVSGVSAAQEYYRKSAKKESKMYIPTFDDVKEAQK